MSEITNLISVEPTSILFPHTYISSISRLTIKIINNSRQNVHFEWRKYSAAEQEKNILETTDNSNVEERQKFADILMFSSPTFKFVPDKGEIWESRSQDFMVDFTPELAKIYDDNVYLYIIETGQRIHLPLHGQGLPPDARFNIDTINIGHVTLESILEYKVKLINVGRVGVDFSIEKKKNSNLIFQFTPDHGHIPIDQSIFINVKFTANAVGPFNEVFTFLIKGATQFHPTLSLYGRVIGPSFALSTKSINFNTISFGFLYSQTFDIENKSQIPFDFTLRLLQDGSFSRREFIITPTTGTIGQYAKQQIKLEFIPTSIKKYNLELHMDIAKFAQSLAIIPIIANCICPDVTIENPVVDLGDVFIGHSYQSLIKLVDNSEHSAKYEYVTSNDTTQLQAQVTVPKPNGAIEALKSSELNFSFKPIQLGPIRTEQYIKIYGSKDPPLPFAIKAVCTGPDLILSSQSINFGSIQVLKNVPFLLKIQNKSLIAAPYKATITCPEGVFTVKPESGNILPNATVEMTVIAYLDDNATFRGKLNLLFENLNPIVLDIKANGTGSPILASIDMSKIALGYIFTERPVVRKITFENKGRKPESVRWVQQKPKIIEGPATANCTFKVTPDQLTMPPHESQEFTLVFQSDKPVSFTMNLQVSTNQKRKRVDLFTPEVTGTFISPILKISKQQLDFKHFYDVKKELAMTECKNLSPEQELMQPMTQTITLKNESKLPLRIYANCPEPFTSSVTDFTLQLAETKEIDVTFDPSFKTDFISETILKKLIFSFKGHPSTYKINLKGTCEFPNLAFIPPEILNFGIMMMNTEQSKDVEVQNVSEIPADYEWQLLPNEKGVDMSKIFDIYPMRSHLDPGQKEITRFTFFSMINDDGKSAQYSGKAVCHIVGGPEYVLSLKGGSTDIRYKIEPLHFDLGSRGFKETLNESFTITNLSDAPIPFSIKVPRSCKFLSITFDPMEGTLAVNQTTKVNLTIVGGLPLYYIEQFFVQIGHFEEVRVDIDVRCYIPQINVDLARLPNDPLLVSYIEHTHSKETPTNEELAEYDTKLYIQRQTERVSLIQGATMKGQKIKKKKTDSIRTYDGYVSSRYLVDFGTIVFGRIEKKDITIKNITPFPISFEIYTDSLNDTGFSLSPSSFQDIPQNESITITITFNNLKRLNDLIGDIELELPIVFTKDLGSMLHIRANLTMPTLNFSDLHFNFGNVIVGQSKIMTLQLQNMNKVNCEFSFKEAQHTNVLQRSMAQGVTPVFTVSPSSGLLEPSSSQNFEITFSPRGDKNYSMQFPVCIKHNTQETFVTMRGTGIQLKITFDPPQLILPPLNPFSEPTQKEVTLTNQTDYPIELMAPQFDLQMLIDAFIQQNPEIEKNETNEAEENSGVTSSNTHVNKFSMCVIVSGPIKSGKTTVSQIVSEYLGVPIVVLKDVWKDLLENTEATQEDYVSALINHINSSEMAEGFVIDGLDSLPEPIETDQFIAHTMKSKNNDTTKNPFLLIPHSNITAPEQALQYVLDSLDGHYIFHIALNAPEEVCVERDERIKASEKEEKQRKSKEAKEALFLMTEDQYLALTEEEREEVDQKRQNLRSKLLKSALESDANSSKDKRSHSSASHKHHHHKSKDGESKDKTDKKIKNHKSKSSLEEKPPEEPAKDNKKKKQTVPTEPIPKSVAVFKYTLGTIAQKIQTAGATFQVVDPRNIFDFADLNDDKTQADSNLKPEKNAKSTDKLIEKSNDANNESSEDFKTHKKAKKKENETITQIEADENELLVTNLANPHVNEEEENEEDTTPKRVLPSFVMTNVNTLLIEVGPSNEEIKKAITTYLPNIQQLEEKSFTRLIPEPQTILPVVKFKKSGISTPLYFSIIGEEVPEDDDQSQSKFRPDSHSAKLGRKSRASGKKESDPLQEYLDELDTSKCTRRWIIEPKSQKTMMIQFSPELIGHYKDTITFQLVNGKSDPFKLNVSGECSYPDIDRSLKTIFTKRVPKLDSKTEFAYALDVNEFHFGSLLVIKEKGKTSHYRQYIVLQNVSKFPVEFNALLTDKQPIWSLETTSGVINVDQTFQLYFGISPIVPNVYKNQLYVFIKDHPDPLCFKLVADACQPIVDISEAALDFDKLLLTQSKLLTLDLKNSGALPAFWRLKNTNTLGDNFTFSNLEGVLKPRGSTSITVGYASTKQFSVKKPIVFEVLDIDKARVFITKQIQVTAESFDVNFDFQYPKGVDHLQYGSLKVGQSKTIPCTLVNKGKYPSNYVLAVTMPKYESMFTISQPEGTLLPNKPITVNFTIVTNSVSKYKNTKGITLTVIDNTTNTTTATLSLPFSVESFYSSYEIEPKKQIPFGPIPINKTVSKSISITNNGIFAFDYEIIPAPNPIVPTVLPAKGSTNTINSSAANKKASPQKVQKGGAKRSVEKSITVGSYTISPASGTIQPGTTQNVDIDYFCTIAGKSRSVVKVKIGDTNPRKYVDNDIAISGESFVPGLNTTEFDKILPNTLLCLKYDLPKITQNAFLEDELILHFAPLILQQKSTVTINLINPYPIPIVVDVALTQKQKTGKNVSPFDINAKQVDIPPNSSSPVTLTFVPLTCDKFSSIFEAVVRGGTDPITKMLKFQIEGSGTLPSISLISQLENKGKSNNYTVNLGKALVGFSKDKTIALKNDGLIPTKLAISTKTSPDFQIVGFDSLQDTTLEPGHILNIPIIYAPQKVRKDQIEINVSVPDNPKASLSFIFSGEGFSEDIIFEGLSDDNDLNFKDSVVGKQQVQTFRLRNVSTEDLRFSWVTNNDFSFSPKNGHLKVGVSKVISVTFMSDKPVKYNALKCNCQWTKIKLEDPNSPDWDDSMTIVKFVPRSALQIESLPPPDAEDLKSRRSQRSNSVKSKNSKTKPTKPSSPITGSPTKHPKDSKDKDSESNESSDQPLSSSHAMDDEIVKVVETKPEPLYESLFPKPKDLLMKINAIADYVKYQIDTTEIAFTPTMMYQTRTSDVKVTNPSSIRFEYSWIVTNFKCLRANYVPPTTPTFSVQPSSGYIEPNQHVIFKVKFHPEEVDDFTADLKMDIPFLTQQEPPKIALSGFSRRPLCHFNVEMSDYLTAGRRHPDFTEPLPADCKVIELFSPHVGAKRFKRFEIINPTSSPYEIVWTLKSSPENLSIACDSENAFVSSGKRYSASFSYTPTTAKTVEVLWEFSIPEHGISIPFLTVGRIMPTVK